MTFDELIKKVAVKRGLTERYTREFILDTFDEIKENVLNGDGRNGIPQFGVFLRRLTKAAIRPVMGSPVAVPASSRVVFRVSTGAKVSE